MSEPAANRILVAGARGQVGVELLSRGTALGFSMSGLDLPEIDITDAASVARVLDAMTPGLIINAAAYTAVDKAESEPALAQAVNADGPKVLAEAAAARGLPLFHISTDYVFDGKKSGPYLETDAVSPLGAYGRTKAAGDDAVRAALETHIILRTAWVYSPHGSNFVKTMLRLAGERDELTVVADQHGCPTAAGDIADALLTIAARYRSRPDSLNGAWGTYHFCSGPATTWCGFAEAIMAGAAKRGERSVPVRAITTADYPTPAARPANSVLDCTKIEETFGLTPPPWHATLGEVLDVLIASKRK
ncbi:MAG: dTDP-4-dehydrorhamnose reductase [Parvibaculaceae bacterium]